MTAVAQAKPLPAPPPSPPGHFLLGHLPELRDILGFYTRCKRDYGDVVKLSMAGWTSFLVSHPDAIETVLPGMVSAEPEDGKIAISQLKEAAPAIFSIGLLAVLYSGLGWLSAMRTALLAVFEKPQKEQPSFLIGKAKDLLALVTSAWS